MQAFSLWQEELNLGMHANQARIQISASFDMSKSKPDGILANLRSGPLQYLLWHNMVWIMLYTRVKQQTWELLSHSSTLKCDSMS